MKITEYNQVNECNKDDLVVIDGDDGTRSMKIEDLKKVPINPSSSDIANYPNGTMWIVTDY